MAHWDYYAETDLEIAGLGNVHAAYAKNGLLFLSGSNGTGMRVLLVSETSPRKFNNSGLKSLDESAVLGIIAAGRTHSLVFEPELPPEEIISGIIQDVQDKRGIGYATRRSLIARYETDPQKAHELAINLEQMAAFLRMKNPDTRVLTPRDLSDQPQVEMPTP